MRNKTDFVDNFHQRKLIDLIHMFCRVSQIVHVFPSSLSFTVVVVVVVDTTSPVYT